MKISHWQLQKPLSAIVFDCDGTLSSIEGIDALAENNGTNDIIQAMTAEAMGKSGINPSLYQKRLDLVYPTREQVITLGAKYFAHQVADAKNVIALLQRLNKSIYLVSAGLFPAVAIFGQLLKIPRENIFAVKIYFDPQGLYLDFDRASPLVTNQGKRMILTELKQKHADIMYVGDGLNDLAVYDIVTRFVGYGGIFYRDNIANKCEFYIRNESMSALLPLSLTEQEQTLLTTDEQSLYQKGLALLKKGSVLIKEM
jgi:phosphoserine phosphatase